ncbi:glycosyltransferase family 2 protein [Patescibacteria group bacterium]|nr:glycosyltransferase family 2 protein [Patescibacteria group bacterium]
MDVLTIIYLFYAFIGFYFLFLYFLVYLKNYNKIFSYPKLTKIYSLSVVVPCYNEEKSIGKTIESILGVDYKGLKKIFVVDDCSSDNSFKIIQEYAKKYPEKVVALKTPKNTGKASGSKNYGAQFADTELVAFVDADSYPSKDSLQKMVGYFDDSKVAAVTAPILVQKREKFIEKLQAIEYRLIAFSRKILGFLDSIYVTPGPLAIYRKSYFDKLGRFDEDNLTEDIELTWRLLSKGYRIEMSFLAKVYTVAPDLFKDWYKQRIRWNVGGIQTIVKYRKFFAKRGILGSFVLPFFVFSWVIGLLGIGILIYRGIRRLILHFLVTQYSITAQTAILTLRDINLNPTTLMIFGVALVILSTSYSLLAIFHLKEKEFKNIRLFSFVTYSFIYVLVYPVILVTSIIRYFKKIRSW